MNFIIQNGLPVATIKLTYKSKTMNLNNVLIDTGCAVSIFDIDLVEDIGLTIDSNQGKAVYMYGVGGRSEVCFQQTIDSLAINDIILDSFTIQLGMTQIPFGFSALLGTDFFDKANIVIDYKNHRLHSI